MGRSGYSDDWDDNSCWLYRGAVKSAIRGRRGQAFLKEMLAAMDALPEPRLIADALEAGGDVCAIGSVGRVRGVDMSKIPMDQYGEEIDAEALAEAFGIAPALAREIMYENDDEWAASDVTPERRFQRVRRWIVANIRG